MNIQDRIRQLQANIVKPRMDEQRAAPPQEESPLKMEDSIRRFQTNVVRPGLNSSGVRPPANQAARPEESPVAPRDTHAERIGQLTESGLTPDEAGRVAGFERSVHGAASPQLSDANNTPEAKAERARRIEGMRRTEARQDNYARGQLGGHLTGREAFEARAQQEGLRGTPAAKPQGWQPISQQDFTDRAAGYGLSPEEAARAYGERPAAMRDTGNDRVLQAQGSRAQDEWLKTMPGVHRKHATNDQAKYGDGTPADKITPEQYNARIERRNAERAATNPEYARERQIAKLAKASGKTPDQVREDMFPTGVPQPSEAFLERQAARKEQHARANEAIWERNGYRGHLDAKTSSADPAVVREGLSRLAEITGNPMYLERMKAMDAEDAAKGEHTRGMEKLTAEQKQALLMQDDLQAGDLEMETLQQKGKADSDGRQAAELDKERTWKSGEAAAEGGRALSVIELNQKNQLEQMEKQRELSKQEADQLSLLRQKEATHAAGIAEEAAAKQYPRELGRIAAEGKAQEGVVGAKDAGKGTPSSYGRKRADEGLSAPGASVAGLEQSLANDIRTEFPNVGQEEALVQAQNELKASALRTADNIPGSDMPVGIRDHLKEEIRRGADGQGKKPMSQVQFREYAIRHGLSPAAADRVYSDLVNPPVPSTGNGALPPIPPGMKSGRWVEDKGAARITSRK
jgi:hypothetical protein